MKKYNGLNIFSTLVRVKDLAERPHLRYYLKKQVLQLIVECTPKTFSFISPLYNSGDISIGEDVLLAAYPAGFLSGISIAKDLYISSAITQIIGVFTFKEGALDLFSIGGS